MIKKVIMQNVSLGLEIIANALEIDKCQFISKKLFDETMVSSEYYT